MRLILEVLAGPFARKRLELWESQTIRIGRTGRADFAIPHDTFLSSLHFSVSVAQGKCFLRDLGSTNGTFVNETRVIEAELKDGELVRAGQTQFSVSISAAESTPAVIAKSTIPRPAPPAFAGETRVMDTPPSQTIVASKPEVLKFLASRPQPVFALLDSARDNRVLEFLGASECLHQSLYQGPKGENLKSVAPYLVDLPKGSALLPKLIDKAWGQSWGVYLTCQEPFAEVRKHLRRFLTVKGPEGQKFLFRFYDPRVLRVYLPSTDPEERRNFFGPVRTYITEGEKGNDMMLFTPPKK